MRKQLKIRINILVCIVIFSGFLAVLGVSYNTYGTVIRDDIMNISKLTATNIYSDISSELTKPIFVSLTMANDSFVKRWLLDEKAKGDSLAHQDKLTQYLNGLKKKYSYNSVFLVSDATKKYYHFNGVNKVISSEVKHDEWYYQFVNKNVPYILDVDNDEANLNRLSIFINCRIEDSKNKLMGVTGVGLELTKVQQLLSEFEDDFQLTTILFDAKGVVQVDTKSDGTRTQNVFDSKTLVKNKSKVLNEKESLVVLKYEDDGESGYAIVKYIKELNWYLLVKKDTSVLEQSFQSIFIKNMLIFVLVMLLVIVIIARLIRSSDDKLMTMAKTDALTGLPNRRGFNDSLEDRIADAKNGKSYFLIVFDIDRFKKINDLHGHLAGDKVITFIGQIVQNIIGDKGMISRWGGDEFAGFIQGDKEEVLAMAREIFQAIGANKGNQNYKATISMGITGVQETDTVDTSVKRADEALYRAKEDGKNRFVFLGEEVEL